MTDEHKDNLNKARLINVLRSYTETTEQNKIVSDMIKNKATVKDYVLALADGLKYGNWPWVSQHGDTTRSLMNQHRYHITSCPAYADNEFQCDCGMVR